MVNAPRAALPPGADLARRLAASPLLAALDIDGTLAPIAPTPEKAAVPDATRRTLERLASLPNVHVVFVTGRAASDGRRLVNVGNTWTIGNHGMELIDPMGTVRVNPSVEAFAPAIATAARMLAEPLTRYDGVFVENKRWTLSVHFRLADPTVVPNVERVLTGIATELGLLILEGKKIFELRPPVAINKGTALIELARSLGVIRDNDLVGSLLYAGDDRTDEDAFRALPPPPSNAIALHVGRAELPEGFRTHAEFVADDPLAVHELLQWLVSVREQALTPRT